MDNKPEILRSAARELCSFIDKANGVLQAGILSTDMQPPDYHDHQTCHELGVAANYVEELEQEVERLKETIELSIDFLFAYDNQKFVDFCGKPIAEARAELIDSIALHKEGES